MLALAALSYCASTFLNFMYGLLQQLARLLKSRNPEDLQAANRLIKNMVKQVNTSFDMLEHFKSAYWCRINGVIVLYNCHVYAK